MITRSSKTLHRCFGRFGLVFAGILAPPAAAQREGLPPGLAQTLRGAAIGESVTAAVPLCFAEEAKLTASDAEPADRFGSEVSLSGDRALVAAVGDTTGAAYVFVRSGTSWTEEAKLVSSDIEFNDFFGSSAALSGDRAIVGATGDDDKGSFSGSAYVFVRSGTIWTEEAKLTASDGKANDQFGCSAAISGDRAIVGAWLDSGNGNGQDSGSAYVFVRSGSSWIEEAKLTASDGAYMDHFGRSVAISGDRALVGVPDESSAYVFERSGTTWFEQSKLWPSIGGFRFGTSVAISGDRVLVGAPDDDANSVDNAGSAFVFVRSGAFWFEEDKLIADDPEWGDDFGISVSLSGDMALVGDHLEGGDAGAAYVFARTGTSWSQVTKLVASNPLSNLNDGHFGASVSLSGGTALVGATEDYGNEPGSAYVFVSGSTCVYCTAGVSASGCQASIGATGTPSATAPSGFSLVTTGMEGSKEGMYFWGTNGKQANTWGNGTSYQCVAPPVLRAGTFSGTGTPGDCDGSIAQDLNALWCPTCPKPHKNPGAGAVVQAQLWYRDPLSTSNQTTSLSDAIEFAVAP
jgi:hypothetical protein